MKKTIALLLAVMLTIPAIICSAAADNGDISKLESSRSAENGYSNWLSESGERTIWDVVEKLPHGMDTVLGDGGIRLSGGERQRVVLARVLLGNPKLIVMNNALPYLTTDLTNSEILSLAYRLLPLASSISISSHTVPASDCYNSANIRGMSVLVPDLPLIRQRLEEYLPLE